ncbi:MAG: SocA family protein [Acidobacteria bacterium]|nr:SocA family protein [Acidobacteriota bacterium]
MDALKFKTLVHYICWRCNDPVELGSIKLNKTLWLSDFRSHYQHGQSITGARYVKRQYGPVPAAILPMQKELECEGRLAVKTTDYHGYQKTEYKALTAPDTSIFTDRELEIIDQAIDFVCRQNTAKSISEHSHDEIWRMAEIGEEIPYFTIFARPGELTEDEIMWGAEQIESA